MSDVKPFIMHPYRDAENHGWDDWEEIDLTGNAYTRLCRALDGTFGPCEPAMYVRAARAWKALRDWLDGTAEQWQAECDQAYREGCDRGVEYERHDTHYLRVQLKELNDRHMALIKRVAEGQSMLPPRVLVVSDPNKVTP